MRIIRFVSFCVSQINTILMSGESNFPLCKEDGLNSQIRSEFVEIGKSLILSLTFPLHHTVHATFTAHGAPSDYH